MPTTATSTRDNRAQRVEPRRVRWTRRALAGMFVAGALGHGVFVAVAPEIYEGFAATSPFGFVRDAWRDLFTPHARLLGAGLAGFELGLGVLFATGHQRARRVAVVGAIAFHVALLAFGWWYLAWSAPMIVLLVWFDRTSRDEEAARGC